MLKLLIVDDEPLVRDGLRYTIDWQDYGIEVIGTAVDGLDAVRTIQRSVPDIVLTDIRMPSMNGLELAEWINSRYPEVYIIFLTGYSEFEYARNALKYEVVDYLLKPVKEEEFKKVINKITNRIGKRDEQEKERARLQKILDDSMPILKEKFIHDLLNQEITPEETGSKMQFYNIDLAGDSHLLIIAELDLKNTEINNPKEIELMKLKISDVLHDKLDIYGNIYKFNHKNKSIGLILSMKSADCTLNQYNRILSVLERIRKEAAVHVCIITLGVSNLHEGINSLPLCYREAERALDKKIYLGKNVVIPAGDINYTRNAEILNFNRNDLIRLFLSYDIVGVKNWMEKYFNYYKINCDTSNNHFQFIIFEFISILLEVINREDIYSEIRFDFTIIDEFILCETMEELFQKIFHLYTKMMVDIKTCKNQLCRKLIEDIKKYVNKNYMNDISRKTASEEFYINPSYLSRIFSQEMNMTFTEYLTKCRIEKAKELLNDPKLKIYAISEMIGYYNEKYFARIFKKYEGISPYEYKEKNSLK